MTFATFIQKKDFKIIGRIGAFLSVLVVLSCGKTNTSDVTPQSLLTPEQYSIEVAKTLYNSIKVNNYNLKATKENFISNVTKNENDVVRNTTNSLATSKRFSNLFNSPISSNARNSADEVGDINLGNV